MIFILLFVAGGIIVPMIVDSKKNPGNNIFKRAWKDVVDYKNHVAKK